MSAATANPASGTTHPHKKRRLLTNGQPKPTATLYEASSQYRRWTFEPKKLKAIRQVVNKRAIEICKQNFQEEEASPRSVHLAPC
ncbi:hypothetical protein NCC49_003453 [Naganishia albida]|nr:hypothetical protein NCC49_003453 [Naganishia albida]